MLNLAYLVVGVVVVEVVFVYPGMGQYLVDHVAKRDVPVVQAVRADLCGRLYRAEHRGRRRVDPRQSAAEAPEMRIPLSALIGLFFTGLLLLRRSLRR
jgi:peptide/nickel transport system permease protein